TGPDRFVQFPEWRGLDQYSGIGGAGAPFFSGMSVTSASVVSRSPAMDAAFCTADRVTLVGSMMPALTISVYSPLAASYPCPLGRPRTFSTTTEPSAPALVAI